MLVHEYMKLLKDASAPRVAQAAYTGPNMGNSGAMLNKPLLSSYKKKGLADFFSASGNLKAN